MRAAAVVLLALVPLALAGCIGTRAKGVKADAAKSGRGPITCSGAGISSITFPAPGSVTFVSSRRAGPTKIYDGYAADGLKDTYTSFENQLREAGYEIEHDEREEHDAEIEYRGKTAEGQVALRDVCRNGYISVHVTQRPR